MSRFTRVGWVLWDMINYTLVLIAIIGLLFGAAVTEYLKILL